jgi:hypothetical protein
MKYIYRIEKEEAVRSFLRFKKRPKELILDPTCFMSRDYLEGTIEIAKSAKIDKLWIPETLSPKSRHMYPDRNQEQMQYLVDTLMTWKPEKASEFFAWFHTDKFRRLNQDLIATEKLSEFGPKPDLEVFMKALSKIEEENSMGAYLCAQILCFSFREGTPILLPELGLTNILKRSGNALIHYLKDAKNKKFSFFCSLIGKDRLARTDTLRWIAKGYLALSSIVCPIPLEARVPASIGLWVIDP